MKLNEICSQIACRIIQIGDFVDHFGDSLLDPGQYKVIDKSRFFLVVKNEKGISHGGWFGNRFVLCWSKGWKVIKNEASRNM